MSKREFPKGFLWGTSTSSFQIEMGAGQPSVNSDWWVWVHDKDNIEEGNASGIFPENGPGFWELYKEDLKKARDELCNNAIRLSIDWSRIFPRSTTTVQIIQEIDEQGNISDVDIDYKAMSSLQGLADKASVKRYRDILSEANRLGLTVFLTLYHWPLPLWLHDPLSCRDNLEMATRRGWLDQRTLVEYAKYAGFVAKTFGDLVDLYATINEAPILSKYSYLHEKVHFPPGLSDVDLFLKVFKNLAIAHGLGYQQVKQWDNESATGRDPAEVGVVTVLEQYDPAEPENERDREAAKFNNYLWNEWNLNAVIGGDYDMNLDGYIQNEEHMPHLVKGCDFIGADYYLRERVQYVEKGNDSRFNFEFAPSQGKISDTGWEIYPEGLGIVLRWAFDTFGLPMYVTENGVADAGDKLRVEYLLDHLGSIYEVIKNGVDVRGYFYLSLLDNYSWFSGYKSRFGLYSVDMTMKKRRPTSGVEVYRQIASENKLPD